MNVNNQIIFRGRPLTCNCGTEVGHPAPECPYQYNHFDRSPEQECDKHFTGVKTTPYVIVHHIPTRRAFSLDRGYRLIKSSSVSMGAPLGMLEVDRWKGWKPTAEWQLPEWAKPLPENEFTAVWYEG